MTATGHAIIGTLIAAKVTHPAFAIPLALVTHLAADALPHWDVGTHAKEKSYTVFFLQAAFDVILGLVVSFLLIYWLFPKTNISYALMIIFFSQFFDWATAPYLFFKMKIPPFEWMYNFQKLFDTRMDKPWGIINQVAVLVAGIILVKLI